MSHFAIVRYIDISGRVQTVSIENVDIEYCETGRPVKGELAIERKILNDLQQDFKLARMELGGSGGVSDADCELLAAVSVHTRASRARRQIGILWLR